MAGIAGGHRPPTAAFRAFLLRSLPRGPQDRPEQGWEDKAGPMQSRSR